MPSISREQHAGVHHDAVGDHRRAAGGEDPEGSRWSGEPLAARRRPCARRCCHPGPHAIIHGRPELVGRLALALVAPLGAEDHDGGHAGTSFTGRGTGARAGSDDVHRRRGPGCATASGLLQSNVSRAAAGAGRPIRRPRAPAGAGPGTGRTGARYPPPRGATAADHQRRRREQRRGEPRSRPGGVAGSHRRRGGRHLQPGRAGRGPAPARGPPGRGGRRGRQPARGDRGAAPSPRAQRRRRRPGPARHRQRLRPRRRHPPGSRGGRPGGGARHRAAGRPDRRLPRRGGGEQRARRRGRDRQPQRAEPQEGARPVRLRARRGQGGREAAVRAAAGRGRRPRRRRLRAPDPDGRDRQRLAGRRRSGDHSGGRPRGRQARRDGVVLDDRLGQARVRRDVPSRPAPQPRRRALRAAHRVSVSGQDFYCSADGELYGPERNRTWSVEPAAFSMPLPNQSG